MSSLYGYAGGLPAPDDDRFATEPDRPPASSPMPRVLGVVALVALLAGGIGFVGLRATRDRGESIVRVRNYPARYEGRTVTIRGRAGESFQVGGSWAYYLHQDGDTIVVFSRTGAPRPSQTVSIHGSISVGYLDGQPRPALFETPR